MATASGSHESACSSSSDALRTPATPPSSLTSRFWRDLPEPGDVVEHARRHPLAPQLAVEGVGEAVGLVADPLQQEQRLGLAGDVDRVGPAGHVDLLEPLGQRRDRDLLVEAEVAHDPLGHGQLALAAVDQQQLRRVGEPPGPLAPLADRAVPLDEVGGEAAGQHLLHGGVVVVAGDVLDLEAAVLALLGQAVLHHHHRADVVGALEVGHVVALDAQRRLGQAEQVLQLVERPGPAVVVAGPAQAVAGELLLRVAGDRLEQRLACRPGAGPGSRPGSRAGWSATPRTRPGLGLDGHAAPASARRAAARRRTAPRGCGRPASGSSRSSTLSSDEALAPDHPAPAHEEHLDRGLELVVGDADHVDVLVAVGHHLLLARWPCAPRRAGPAGGPPARTPARRPPRASRASRRLTIASVSPSRKSISSWTSSHVLVVRRSRRRTARSTSRCGTAGTAGRGGGAG